VLEEINELLEPALLERIDLSLILSLPLMFITTLGGN